MSSPSSVDVQSSPMSMSTSVDVQSSSTSMSMSMSIPSAVQELYDCSGLLQYAADCETAFTEQYLNEEEEVMSFGHPDAPRLHMFDLSDNNDNDNNDNNDNNNSEKKKKKEEEEEDCEPANKASPRSSCSPVWMIAYTSHCVAGQLLFPVSDADRQLPTIPMDVATLYPRNVLDGGDGDGDGGDDDGNGNGGDVNTDEVITCLTVMALEEADNSSARQKLLLVAGNRDRLPLVRLAVALGTNNSRLLSTEILLDRDFWTLQRPAAAAEGNHHGATFLNSKSNSNPPNTSTSSSLNLYEVLPRNNSGHFTGASAKSKAKSKSQSQRHQRASFAPTGGVTSVSTFRMAVADAGSVGSSGAGAGVGVGGAGAGDQQPRSQNNKVAFVWIAYRDGTLVRLHHAGLFPSVWQRGADEGKSIEDLFRMGGSPGQGPGRGRPKALVRCKVHLPATLEAGLQVQPLPRYFPSPLAPLWKAGTGTAVAADGSVTTSDGDSIMEEAEEEQDESEDDSQGGYEALVFGCGADTDADQFPTLCFYTSEDHLLGRGGKRSQTGFSALGALPTVAIPSLGAVVGGTKALMGGVFGSALRWGLGRSNSAVAAAVEEIVDENEGADADAMEESEEEEGASGPFPSLWRMPIGLFAGNELHDMPRKVESCSVDPDGSLAAVTDALGRVVLIDLSSKQVVRLWKGFRDASCYWIQARSQSGSGDTTSEKRAVFLVIHSRQRRVVEVFHARHGSRLCSVQVGRDAQVVPCSLGVHMSCASCYLVHSNVPGTSFNQTEKIKVDGLESLGTSESRRRKAAAKVSSTPSSRDASHRFQHLQQLLSTTNVQCRSEDVYAALQHITSFVDLAACLDLLAGASVLEQKMEVEGSDFQKMAVAHCKEYLGKTTKGNENESRSNPNVQLLTRKIDYHSQIFTAFDVLSRFEKGVEEGEGEQEVSTPPHWTTEAMGWASTYEIVMGIKLDSISLSPQEGGIPFATFASACAFPGDGDEPESRVPVRFSESSRIRKGVLVHVFKPLLADVFSFGVVNSIFDVLGMSDDRKYLLKCFGDWFVTLTPKQVFEKGMSSPNSPMIRWLQDLACQQLEEEKGQDHRNVTLNVLYAVCEESEDLVHSFMLASLCREAVGKASSQKEKETYGKISNVQEVKGWESLLRKVRVCLLVSLRLKGKRIGAFPITVRNVDTDNIFSVYEWLAHDELEMSHDHDEIVSLEKVCKISSYSFDPSCPEGDGPAKFGMLQKSCLSAAISPDERAEYLVDFNDDDKFGALLLYLKSHNNPVMLVAHRALLLASTWSQDPSNMEVLKDALTALQALQTVPEYDSLAAAVRLKVWQSQIRPIYRAHLFGFDDVQEVSENVVAPLLQSQSWLREFGRIALQVLNLLAKIPWKEETMNLLKPQLESSSKAETWPPVRSDFVLQKLVEKSRKMDTNALNAHTVVVSALLVSNDIENLTQCAPAIYECFLPLALFNPVAAPPPNTSFAQQSFLEDAVIASAHAYSGPAMESYNLGEIDALTKGWGFDLKVVRTVFLITMYELERDDIVDDLLTKNPSQIDVPRFVEDGVDIVCRRLNHFLSGKTSEVQNVLGLLDADLCEWVKQRARKSRSLVVLSPLKIPVASTNLFCLRLLSLSASANVDTTLRVKIHSMVVLTGTLVKAFE